MPGSHAYEEEVGTHRMPTLFVGYHGMGRIAKNNQDPTSLDMAASNLGLHSMRNTRNTQILHRFFSPKVCLADWHPIATFRSVCTSQQPWHEVI